MDWSISTHGKKIFNTWIASVLDELSDFRADEADVVRAVMKVTVDKVLKGRPWSLSQLGRSSSETSDGLSRLYI